MRRCACEKRSSSAPRRAAGLKRCRSSLSRSQIAAQRSFALLPHADRGLLWRPARLPRAGARATGGGPWLWPAAPLPRVVAGPSPDGCLPLGWTPVADCRQCGACLLAVAAAAAPRSAVRAAEQGARRPWAAWSLPLDLPLSGWAPAGRRARARRLS